MPPGSSLVKLCTLIFTVRKARYSEVYDEAFPRRRNGMLTAPKRDCFRATHIVNVGCPVLTLTCLSPPNTLGLGTHNLYCPAFIACPHEHRATANAQRQFRRCALPK